MKLEIELPDSLASQLREVTAREQISLDHFVAAALTAQLDAQPRRPSMAERAARVNWSRVDEILARVPADPPAADDAK
jgi:hypothetical protein